MKKFLTVLLALSVVFTYTVGTAFAVTGTEAPSKSDIVTQAEAKAAEQLKRVEAAAIDWVGNPGTYQISSVPVDKELGLKLVQIPADGNWFNPDGVKKLSDVVIGNAKTALDQKVTEIVAATYANQDALNTALAGLKTIADEYTGADTFKSKVEAITAADLAKYSVQYAQETYTKYVESIDELKYSSTPDKDGVINRDKVNKLKSDAKANIEAATDGYGIDNGSVRDIANKFYAAVKAIPTSSEEEDAFKNLAEAKEYYSTKVESELAARKADVKYALSQDLKQARAAKDTLKAEKIEAAIARADADFAAAVQCAKAEIGAQKTIDTVRNMYNSWSAAIPALGYDATNYQPTGYLPIYIARAEKAAELEALANKMKAETGFNGAPVYVATEVDEALADDLEAVYTGGTASALKKLAPAEDLVKSEMDRVINGTADGKVTIDKIKYAAVNSWLVTSDYDDVDKVDEVKAVVAEAKAAIRAAKTVADVDAAFKAAYEKYDAIVTDDDMSKYQKSAAGQASVTKYEAKLSAALIAKKADYGTTKFAQDFEAMNKLIVNLKENYLQKAYDAADMEAKYAEAVKVIDELKTKAALKAEADAINAEILEVSKLTLTAADEERVLAIADREEAFTDYKTLIDVTGYTTYGTASYKAQMKALVKKDLQKAYDAIGTVTVDDEAAINDLIVKAEAFEDNYDEAFDAAKMTKLASDLVKAKIDAVEKAIGAIDASAEKVDVAAVKAAREAYDALGEYGVDVSKTMFHKLLSLENLVEEYTVKAVEALKITASSTAGKGYIKVKWTVKGDASYADGFRVYKSTKRNSGFGSKPYFDTKSATKMTYKNTKELKKGTRYYYKVRAYKVVDGKTYFSDWSNKAYRIAK